MQHLNFGLTSRPGCCLLIKYFINYAALIFLGQKMFSKFFRLPQNQRHVRSFSVSNIASSNNTEKPSDISVSTKAFNPKTPTFFDR